VTQVNTPSHAVLNLAVLGRRAHPEWNWPIVVGAVLPDVPIFLLWIVATVVWRQPQRQIWSKTYFLPGWQIAVDMLHSFPLLALALAAFLLLRLRRAQLLTASMLLHACGDMFLHGADAHRHFFPFSDYRFVSNVSYWDPAHYGNVVLPVGAGRPCREADAPVDRRTGARRAACPGAAPAAPTRRGHRWIGA
jgi:hypothetical protein